MINIQSFKNSESTINFRNNLVTRLTWVDSSFSNQQLVWRGKLDWTNLIFTIINDDKQPDNTTVLLNIWRRFCFSEDDCDLFLLRKLSWRLLVSESTLFLIFISTTHLTLLLWTGCQHSHEAAAVKKGKGWEMIHTIAALNTHYHGQREQIISNIQLMSQDHLIRLSFVSTHHILTSHDLRKFNPEQAQAFNVNLELM